MRRIERDERTIIRPVVQRAEGYTILCMVGAAGLINREYVCCVQQSELNTTYGATVAVCVQYSASELRVSCGPESLNNFLATDRRYHALDVGIFDGGRV